MALEKFPVNNQIPASCKLCMYTAFQTWFQTLQTTKSKLWKIVRVTSFQKTKIAIIFNLLQFCPSVPFVFAMLLIPSWISSERRLFLEGLNAVNQLATNGKKYNWWRDKTRKKITYYRGQRKQIKRQLTSNIVGILVFYSEICHVFLFVLFCLCFFC